MDYWLTWRTHYPRHDGHRFLIGCDRARHEGRLPVNGYELSQDGMTLEVRRHVPGGWHVVTLHRQPAACLFTDADILTALTRVRRRRASAGPADPPGAPRPGSASCGRT